MEFNDVYDKDRNLTGRVHRRGTRWKPGEYGLVVCVWVYDGKGNLLLTLPVMRLRILLPRFMEWNGRIYLCPTARTTY